MPRTSSRRLEAYLRFVLPVVTGLVLAACAGAPGDGAGGGADWTEVSTAAALAGVSLLDVTAFGAGFAAVGNSPQSGSDSFGGAFTSTDGSAWAAAPTTPFKATTTTIVATTSKGLLALGSACGSECFGFQAWLSADGAAWAGPTQPSGDTSRPTGVVEEGSTVVAITTELVDPSINKYQGYVYLSPDATTWSAARTGDSFASTGLAGIATDGAALVIVGNYLHEDGTRDGAAWTSTDGQTWTAATDDGSFKGGLLQAVARGAGGYLAVGSIGADGAVWTSADGRSWVRVNVDGLKGSPLADVASSGSGYVAIGRGTSGAAAWTSKDDKAWQSVAGIPGASEGKFIAVAIGQTRSIIVGQPIGTNPSGLVWLGPLP